MGLRTTNCCQCLNGRQSLVTPIDWKPMAIQYGRDCVLFGRQSLVTPIDWKPYSSPDPDPDPDLSRQSLVTPIDWKPSPPTKLGSTDFMVANLW